METENWEAQARRLAVELDECWAARDRLQKAAERVFDLADDTRSDDFGQALIDLGLAICGEEPNAR